MKKKLRPKNQINRLVNTQEFLVLKSILEEQLLIDNFNRIAKIYRNNS